jgi:hypothetical protein
MRITSTSHCWERYSRIEDYGLKERITPRLRRTSEAIIELSAELDQKCITQALMLIQVLLFNPKPLN